MGCQKTFFKKVILSEENKTFFKNVILSTNIILSFLKTNIFFLNIIILSLGKNDNSFFFAKIILFYFLKLNANNNKKIILPN